MPSNDLELTVRVNDSDFKRLEKDFLKTLTSLEKDADKAFMKRPGTGTTFKSFTAEEKELRAEIDKTIAEYRDQEKAYMRFSRLMSKAKPMSAEDHFRSFVSQGALHKYDDSPIVKQAQLEANARESKRIVDAKRSGSSIFTQDIKEADFAKHVNEILGVEQKNYELTELRKHYAELEKSSAQEAHKATMEALAEQKTKEKAEKEAQKAREKAEKEAERAEKKRLAEEEKYNRETLRKYWSDRNKNLGVFKPKDKDKAWRTKDTFKNWRTDIKDSITQFRGGGESKRKVMVNGEERRAMLPGKEVNWKNLSKDAKEYAKRLWAIVQSHQALRTVTRMIGKGLTMPFSGLLSVTKKLKKPLTNLKNAIKRILIYRSIRAVVSLLTKGFTEGVKNLYHYSEKMGTSFHDNMDKIASYALWAKNAIGAMAGPIINAVTPAVLALAQRFAELANAVGLFIAKITGASQFSKATLSMTKFEKATGKAKDKMKDLLAFDEINRLSDPNSGGGSADADYGGMFEEVSTAMDPGSIEAMIRNAIEGGDWYSVGYLFGEKFNQLIEGANLVEKAQVLSGKINTMLETAVGFLDGFSFSNFGTTLANGISEALRDINWNRFGEMFAKIVTGFLDFGLSLVTDLDWFAVGEALYNTFKGWATTLIDWFLFGHEWLEVGKAMGEGLVNLIKGLHVFDMLVTFVDLVLSAISAVAQLLIGIGVALLEGIFAGFGAFFGSIGNWFKENLVEPFKEKFNSAFFGGNVGADTQRANSTAGKLGQSLIGAIFAGIKKGWEVVTGWLTTAVELVSEAFDSASDAKQRQRDFGSPVLGRASGGFVGSGDLFIANEAGPELVGRIGHRTAVANGDQIINGIANGVASANEGVQSAVYQMANMIVHAINSKDMDISLDGKSLARQMYSYQQTVSNEKGSSLVMVNR